MTSSATCGGHTWMSLIFPSPHSVYVINIIILLLLVHQFAGLCIQQKQMGNICPGRPALPPGPRRMCARSFVGTPVTALLLYADKPYFSGCRSQQGPGVGFQAWLRSGSEGTRMHVWWETGIQDTRPCLGHLRDSWQGLPVFLLSRIQAFPLLCYCRLKSNEILLLVMTWTAHARFRLEGCLPAPSCSVGLLLGESSASGLANPPVHKGRVPFVPECSP